MILKIKRKKTRSFLTFVALSIESFLAIWPSQYKFLMKKVCISSAHRSLADATILTERYKLLYCREIERAQLVGSKYRLIKDGNKLKQGLFSSVVFLKHESLRGGKVPINIRYHVCL